MHPLSKLNMAHVGVGLCTVHSIRELMLLCGVGETTQHFLSHTMWYYIHLSSGLRTLSISSRTS